MILPSVQTERLVLREFRSDDAAELARVEGTEAMVRYQVHEPFDLERAEKYVAGALKSQLENPRKWVELAICRIEGPFIGRVGASLEGEEAWVWYVIGAECQRQGFATEALGALLQILSQCGIQTAKLECDPLNEPSWRLAERLGFTLLGELEDAVLMKGTWCGSKTYAQLL